MSTYKFETLQLHVGQEQADPATDSRAVPIYQTRRIPRPIPGPYRFTRPLPMYFTTANMQLTVLGSQTPEISTEG